MSAKMRFPSTREEKCCLVEIADDEFRECATVMGELQMQKRKNTNYTTYSLTTHTCIRNDKGPSSRTKIQADHKKSSCSTQKYSWGIPELTRNSPMNRRKTSFVNLEIQPHETAWKSRLSMTATLAKLRTKPQWECPPKTSNETNTLAQ